MDDSGQQQVKKPNTEVILSGVLIGPSKAGATDQVGVGGVVIDIVPNGPGAVTKTIVSGLGGGFTSGLITPAKYKLYFKDPNNKYFRSPTPITVGQDMDIPIYMNPAGERRRGKKGHGSYPTSTISGTVFALEKDGAGKNHKKRLEKMIVTIKSIKIDRENTARKIINSIVKRLLRSKTEEKENSIKIERQTNLFGMFFSGRVLPKGTYHIYCADPNGTFLFSTKFIVVKSALVPPVIFIGFTKQQLEEYKRQNQKTQQQEQQTRTSNADEQPAAQRPEEKQISPPNQVVTKEGITIIQPQRSSKTAEDPRMKWRPSSNAPIPTALSHQPAEDRLRDTREQASSEHARQEFKQNENITIHPAGQLPGLTFTNAPPNYINTSSSTPAYNSPTSAPREALTPSRGRGAVNTINRLNNTVRKMSGTGQKALGLLQNATSSPIKWWILGFGIAIILFIIIFEGGGGGFSSLGGGGSTNPSTQTNTTSPSGPTANCDSSGSLGYSIDLSNASVVPQLTDDLKQQILSNWPKAQLQYWDTIVAAAQQNNVNPAFLLTLWIEESGASDKVDIADGGGGDPAGYKSDGSPYYATVHFGCAPWENQTIQDSLSCYFNSFLGKKFDDVMCRYGGDGFHTAPCTFNDRIKGNPEFPGGVKTWYSKLIPSGNGAIQSSPVCITPAQTNPEISSSTLSDVTINLTNDLTAACGNSLTSNNISCMQGINLPGVPYATSAISQLIYSATAVGNYCSDSNPGAGNCLQCVGFVQGAVSGDTGSPLDKGGNAKDYATNIPTGYDYIDKSSGNPVKPGDIIIKTGGDFGHIAVVTKVYDTNNIQVAEANYDYGGGIRLNNTALSPSLWSGWLRKL